MEADFVHISKGQQMTWDYITSAEGMKFLAFIGGGLVVLGGAIWKVLQMMQSNVSAKDRSIAAGRDVNINKSENEDSQSE